MNRDASLPYPDPRSVSDSRTSAVLRLGACLHVLGETFYAARDRCYQAVEKIHFDGAYCRRDIGAQAMAAKP